LGIFSVSILKVTLFLVLNHLTHRTKRKKMKNKISTLAFIALFSLAAFSANANMVQINFSWQGSNNYRMDGLFTFDQSFNGVENLVASNLSTFSFTGYSNDIAIDTWNLSDGVDAGNNFNFNFNTITNEFGYGGLPNTTMGQQWNTVGGTSVNANIGFLSGGVAPNNRQVFVLPGESAALSIQSFTGSLLFRSNGLIASTPTFINTTPSAVPVPAALPLMASALVAFGISRRSKAKA
jgi:hypothetical protein